jgi:predicted GNAT family acetyltransferase
MKHILDRPIWSALSTRHAHLAEGRGGALRYSPSVSLFAATADETPESLASLAALTVPGDSQYLVQADEIVLPDGFSEVVRARAVQMLAERPIEIIDDPRIERLGEADAQEMLDLALLTKPGPFTLKSQALGSFWGIKEGGRLLAMAGERLRQPSMTELSGVAVQPDQQGKGFGRLLSVYVAGQIAGRGEQAYLHAYATNTKAIALYESIGFRLRTELNVVATKREA